jgi:hypothetical protein
MRKLALAGGFALAVLATVACYPAQAQSVEKHKYVDGAAVLTQHPRNMPNGTHSIHKTPTGLNIQVQIHQGKIQKLRVVDPWRRPLHIHRHPPVQGHVFFGFWDARANCWVWFWFPTEMVAVIG